MFPGWKSDKFTAVGHTKIIDSYTMVVSRTQCHRDERTKGGLRTALSPGGWTGGPEVA